jgi:2,4-dienoyl-CoA reductase-like NADH-dependent reductase (Old Yellow Enzyme family)
VRHIDVNHRAVLAPLTHLRAYPNHVPGPHAATYYAQHASVSGTLEASTSQVADVMDSILGIYMQEQVAVWKEITDAVHEKKCFIFVSYGHLGGQSFPSVLAKENNASCQCVSVLDPWLRRVNAVNFVTFSEDVEVLGRQGENRRLWFISRTLG